MKNTYPDDVKIAIHQAVCHFKDFDAAKNLLESHCELIMQCRGQELLREAARKSVPKILDLLIDKGWGVDQTDLNGESALSWAVTFGMYENAETLLRRGANPDIRVPLFSVATADNKDPVKMAALLIEHGADVNKPFVVDGMPVRNALSQAVEVGNAELANYLRSKGARMPNPLIDGIGKPKKTRAEAGDYTAQIISHINTHFGKPDEGAIVEIVPASDWPIKVIYVPHVEAIDASMLFTVGLSRYEMNVPRGQKSFKLAELRVALPKTWPEPKDAIKEPKYAWPIHWLQRIAAFPFENQTWLGGNVTTIANDNPPQPLGKGTQFTAWLLASPDVESSRIRIDNFKTINLYQLFPLYTEEYQLERSHGVGVLIDRVHEIGMEDYINVNRPNLAT